MHPRNRHARPSPLLAGLVAALMALTAPPAAAQWRLEGWFGDAWNARTPLTIAQEGEAVIRVTPNWSTRPWTPTWYYGARVSRWSGGSGWGVEYLHHKLYLDNPPAPEVTKFWITNGVNIVLLERLLRVGKYELALGAGPTWVVPRSVVRGEEYDFTDNVFGSRYDFGGWTGAVGITRRVQVVPRVHGTLSVKATASLLDVPIARGRAETTNLALHVGYGISLQTTP